MIRLNCRQTRWLRLFSGVLAMIYAANFGCVMALADGLTDKPASKVKPTLDHISSLVIFPVNNEAGDDSSGAALRLWTGIKLKINDAGRFHAIGFTPTLAAVNRAVGVDDTLTVADITPPFDGPDKAGPVSKAVGADGYVTTTLVSETLDPVKQRVELDSIATVYAVGYDDPIGSVTVKGIAIASSHGEDLAAVEQRAIDSASGKIAQYFSPVAVTSSQTTIAKTHNLSKANNVLFWLLLTVVAGAAISAARSRTDISSGSATSTTTSSSSSSSGTLTPPSAPSL